MSKTTPSFAYQPSHYVVFCGISYCSWQCRTPVVLRD